VVCKSRDRSHDASELHKNVCFGGFDQYADVELGASNGRGPRCSGWFADYIADQGDDQVQSLTLGGGIKGWVKAGEPFIRHMEGFEPEYWMQFD
jgi:hypothetical protein